MGPEQPPAPRTQAEIDAERAETRRQLDEATRAANEILAKRATAESSADKETRAKRGPMDKLRRRLLGVGFEDREEEREGRKKKEKDKGFMSNLRRRLFGITESKAQTDAEDKTWQLKREQEQIKLDNDPLRKFIRETMGEDPNRFRPVFQTTDINSLERNPDGSLKGAKDLTFNNYHDFLSYRRTLTEEQKREMDLEWESPIQGLWQSPEIFADKELWKRLNDPNDPFSKHKDEFSKLIEKAKKLELSDDAEIPLQEIQKHIEQEQEEVKEAVKQIPEQERSGVLKSLLGFGFKVDKWKNNAWSKIFSPLAKIKNQDKFLARMMKELGSSFSRDAKNDEKRFKDLMEGKGSWKTNLMSPALLVGNIYKYGRLITDVTGKTLAMPYRYVTMLGMGISRLAEAGKEAQLKTEEASEKTRIKDEEKAAEEAFELYRKVVEKTGDSKNVTSESIQNEYLSQLPKDLLRRLQVPSVASGWAQKIIKWDISKAVEKLDKNLKKIDENKKYSAKEKTEKKLQLLNGIQWKNALRDYDRLITEAGTVDEIAVAAIYAKALGRGLVGGALAGTIETSIARLVGGLHSSGEALLAGGPEQPDTSETTRVALARAGAIRPEVVDINHEPSLRHIPGVGERMQVEPLSPETPAPAVAPGAVQEIHVAHRLHLVNSDIVNSDGAELQTHWGGVGESGLTANGEYTFNINRMLNAEAFNGNVRVNIGEELRLGHLKMLVTLDDGRVIPVSINPDGQIIIPDGSPAESAFTTVNGHAVFNGRFAEVAVDKGNNDFQIVSTVTEGSGAGGHITPPEQPLAGPGRPTTPEQPADTPEPIRPPAETPPRPVPAEPVETPRPVQTETTPPRPAPEDVVRPRGRIEPVSTGQSGVTSVEDYVNTRSGIPRGEAFSGGRSGVTSPEDYLYGGRLRSGIPRGEAFSGGRSGVSGYPPDYYQPGYRGTNYSPYVRRVFEDVGNPYHLQDATIGHVSAAYDAVLHDLFPTDTYSEWNRVAASRAADFMRIPLEGTPAESPVYRLLILLNQLKTQAGISPHNSIWGHESIKDYVARAMQKIAGMPRGDGILDEITRMQ